MPVIANFKRCVPAAAFATLSLALLASKAYAGADGAEFDNIYTLIQGWATGTLGRIIALSIVLVGLGAAVVSRSFMPLVGGIVAALVMVTAPTVVEGIITASLTPEAPVTVLPAVEAFLAG